MKLPPLKKNSKSMKMVINESGQAVFDVSQTVETPVTAEPESTTAHGFSFAEPIKPQQPTQPTVIEPTNSILSRIKQRAEERSAINPLLAKAESLRSTSLK